MRAAKPEDSRRHYSTVCTVHLPCSRYRNEHGRHGPIGSRHGGRTKGVEHRGPIQLGTVIKPWTVSPRTSWGHTPSPKGQRPIPPRAHGVGVHGVMGHPRAIAWVRPIPAPSPLPPVIFVAPVVPPPPAPPVTPCVHGIPPAVRVMPPATGPPSEGHSARHTEIQRHRERFGERNNGTRASGDPCTHLSCVCHDPSLCAMFHCEPQQPFTTRTFLSLVLLERPAHTCRVDAVVPACAPCSRVKHHNPVHPRSGIKTKKQNKRTSKRISSTGVQTMCGSAHSPNNMPQGHRLHISRRGSVPVNNDVKPS